MAINFNGTTFSAKQTTNNLVNFNGTSMCTVVDCTPNNKQIVYDCQCGRICAYCGWGELCAQNANRCGSNPNYLAFGSCTNGIIPWDVDYDGHRLCSACSFSCYIQILGYVPSQNAWYDLSYTNCACSLNPKQLWGVPFHFCTVFGDRNATATFMMTHAYPEQLASVCICTAASCVCVFPGCDQFSFSSCGRSYNSGIILKGITEPIVTTDNYTGTVNIAANATTATYSGWDGQNPIGYRVIQYCNAHKDRWKLGMFIPSINGTTGSFRILEAGCPVATNFCAQIECCYARSGTKCFCGNVTCLVFGIGIGEWAGTCMVRTTPNNSNLSKILTGSTWPTARRDCIFNFIGNNIVTDGVLYQIYCSGKALYPVKYICWSCVDFCAAYGFRYGLQNFMQNCCHYCTYNGSYPTYQPTIWWRPIQYTFNRCGATGCTVTSVSGTTNLSI